MKNQRDKLRQYQKRITVLTDREKEIAKECLAKGDVKRAKLALRRKKYQESLLSKTDAQLAELERLTNDVEFAQVQKDVLYGLQQGTAVLKEIHREMGGIENVEKLMGENEEAIAYQEVPILTLTPNTKSSPRILIRWCTGYQPAPLGQDDEPRRRRSRGRARASGSRGQWRHCAPHGAPNGATAHSRRESTGGKG